MPSLKAFRAMSGLPDSIRRWSQAAEQVKRGQQAIAIVDELKREAPPMDWPANVAREVAEADGRKPEDFRYDQWPVSNVRCENSDSRHYPFYFRCDMPKDTPVSNQYDDANEPIPDPVGMCSQSVDFRLHDADTGEKLAENTALLHEGHVVSKPRDRQELWRRLTPGTSIRVKLVACPMFYFLNEQGAMMGYAIGNQGYFKGEEVESPVYTLTMDHDGNVSVG